MEQMQELRAVAKMLRDDLGQHLAGTVLTSAALSVRLTRRHAPEAKEAAYLLGILINANKELNCLITRLDEGTDPRPRSAPSSRNVPSMLHPLLEPEAGIPAGLVK